MSAGPRTIRVGGVPEHFNLPWVLAVEERAFEPLGVEVEWISFPGGTGAIMAALADSEIDLATPLTEGAVTSIAGGNPSRILRIWVESPLLWGVHVAAAADARTIADCEGARIAISRHGSGSELMGYVMVADRGWNISAHDFVVVGGLDGALAALPAGEADVFLWNKTMTQPHVDDGTFRRVGVLPTPWPSFATVAAQSFLDTDRSLAGAIAETAARRAATLAADDGAIPIVMKRYGLNRDDVADWLQQVRWAAPDTPIDPATIGAVAQRMLELGRIAGPVPVDNLLA